VILKWAGGKSWLTKNHPQLFHSEESITSRAFTNQPSIKFKKYIEPFLGGGAVFKYMKPNKKSILADINDELIIFYNELKNHPTKLYKLTKEHMAKHSEDYYYQIRAIDKLESNLERAARFLYLNRTCYNGIYRVNSKNKFNVPIGDSKDFNVDEDQFINYSKLLKNAKIVRQDFRKTIEHASRGDFLFIDPPYVTESNQSSFDMYSANQFNWNDQIELSDILQSKNEDGVNIMVTNINDKDIAKLFRKQDGWNHIALNRANVMSYNAEGKKYKEIVFKNF
jgi:DNA adenine methylase